MPHKAPADSLFAPLQFKKFKPATQSWWAPIWRGLVVEGSAKHYRAMRSAIWLYFYLIVHADRRTGTLYRRIPTIARDMGVNPATISRWMATLASRGYIVRRSTGRALQITIARWKGLAPRTHQRNERSSQESSL
jgi:hypothetical protein